MAQLPDAPEHLARTSSLDSPREVAKRGGDTGHTIHAAIIMDGSGRWAAARGLPRSAGHYEGVEAVRRTVRLLPPWGSGP